MNKNKRKKLFRKIFSNFTVLKIAVVFAVLVPLSVSATTYSLSSPVPSETGLPHVIQGRQSYAGQHIMWRDSDGHINIINSFGGADVNGNENAYFHYVNTFTGAHALVEGGKCSFGRGSVYDPTHNKLYWGGEYCSNASGGSFNEFDPATMTNTVIEDGGDEWFTGGILALGKDGRIYDAPMESDYSNPSRGQHLFSYDPEVGSASWTDYGIFNGNSDGISVGIAVDATDIYVASKGKLMTHPIGDGAWSEISLPGTATQLSVHMETGTKKWFLSRSTDNGSSWQNYWLENSGATLITGTSPDTGYGYVEDTNKNNLITMMGYGDYNGFINAYDYDMNWDDNIPNPSNTHSVVRYGPHSSWNYPTSDFSTSDLTYAGPWYDLSVDAVAPHSGASKIYAFGQSVGDYDYSSQTPTPAGTLPSTSIYYAMRVPAAFTPSGQDEFYYSGYANQAWRWNPALPRSGTNPVNATPSQHMNYRVFMDYDSAGKIWIGSNYCGATAGCKDFGSLAWYDPANATNGEIFADAWTGGNPGDPGFDTATEIQYRSFAMSNNRSKVVVSSNDGKLTVINALTKTIEGSYNLGVNTWMVEVADDQVLGVTTSGDPAGERVFLFRPSDRTMIIAPHAIGVSGNTFGGGEGHISRRAFKLEKGPDGYAWIYVDNKIYRVNPLTLAFELIATDTSGSNKLKWADNKLDLIVYGETNTSYYPNLLTASNIGAPALHEVTAVPTPTKDPTPDYTFNSDQAGTISYAGGCISNDTSANAGDNIITFNALSPGTYDSCTIIVTDASDNPSDPLSVSSFVIDTTAPNLSFTNDVEAGPVTSDAISASWGDASVKKWDFDSDGICSNDAGDYSKTEADSMNQSDESNNGKYICLYGEDAAGNKSTLVSANSINIDTSAPANSDNNQNNDQNDNQNSISISRPGLDTNDKTKEISHGSTTYFSSHALTFRGDTTGLENGRVDIYSGKNNVGTKTISASGKWTKRIHINKSGTQKLTFRYFDADGNLIKTSASYEIKIDTSGPKFTDLPLAINKRPGQEIFWKAKDNDEIKYSKYTFRGKMKKTTSSHFSLPSEIARGSYILRVKIFDRAGNSSSRKVVIHVL